MIQRTHLQQRSAELDEVREAIGLRPAAPAANWPDPGEPTSRTVTPSPDTAGGQRYPADWLSGRVRRVLAALTIVSAGVALTHQMLAGALASAHGAGLWGAAAALLAWPVPLIQPILAGAGALLLSIVGMLTGGWRPRGSRQNGLVVAGAIAAVLGAGPMVLICGLTVVVGALALAVGLVIACCLLALLGR
jgi:hypothetical protein